MSNIKVAFFTEAGTNRGMGHLVRTYCIYKEFAKKFDTYFYLDSDIDYSYQFDSLNNFKWNNLNLEEEFDIIFIDSYIASMDIYNKLSDTCKLCVYLDDYSRLDYPKGLIINFAPDCEEKFFKKKKSGNTYLLGLDYIPIREILIEQEVKKDSHIFISLGGATKDEIYLELLENLESINSTKVVVSNSSSLKKNIKNFNNIKLLYKPSEKQFVEEMSSSRFAISTASMTVYELSFFRIPNIIMALTKNQEIGLPQFLKYELANYAINFNDKNYKDDLINYIDKIKNIPNSSSVIDGYGAKRIMDECLEIIGK